MATAYTAVLKLALPVTGELSGTWGDTVNDNITSMIEQAIAGLSTINTWTTNSHTLTTANGTTSESRCAMLVAATGGGAPTAAASIICPAATKLYVLQNNTSFAVTLKTPAGTGIAVAVGDTAFLFCDGTNVNACVTTVSGNITASGIATLTNKRIDPRTFSTASTATLTPNIASFDQYNLTAQAVGLTVAAPTGTPVDGNRITLRILDNGTGQTITWNATYTVIGVTLPVLTTANKMIYVGCIYNSTNTRWDVVAVATQA